MLLCCVLTVALFADLTGVTPDPLGDICTSPLKRVFRYVLFGHSKAAGSAMPDPRGHGGVMPDKNLIENYQVKEMTWI